MQGALHTSGELEAHGEYSTGWACCRHLQVRSVRGLYGCSREARCHRSGASTAIFGWLRPGAARERSQRIENTPMPAGRRSASGEQKRTAARTSPLYPPCFGVEIVFVREDIFFATTPGRNRFGSSSCGLLLHKQTLENVDCGCKGGTHRAILRFAIPPSIFKLFVNKTLDQRVHVLTEIDTQRDCPAIDARLSFAFEERLPCMFPVAAHPHPLNCTSDSIRVWIDSEVVQQLKCRKRSCPGLALVFFAPCGGAGGETCASSPLAILSLQSQKPGAPTLADCPSALAGDDFSRRIQ